LVQLRDSEHGHDRVADELLHPGAMPLERRPRLVEVAGLEPSQGFRIEPLSRPRVAGEIAEEHGHGLAGLACELRLGGQLRTAGAAEAEAVGALLAANRADRHAERLRPGGTLRVPRAIGARLAAVAAELHRAPARRAVLRVVVERPAAAV